MTKILPIGFQFLRLYWWNIISTSEKAGFFLLTLNTRSIKLQVNQIGTVTESIQAALDSKAAGWGVMVSHRSGETEDNFIADLSVGLASGQVWRNSSLYSIFNDLLSVVVISLLLIVLYRSKQELPAGASVWPSTIRYDEISSPVPYSSSVSITTLYAQMLLEQTTLLVHGQRLKMLGIYAY